MKSWLAPIVLGVTALSLTACFHDDDDDNGFIAVPDNRAQVRVLHASPDTPNVDVLVDDGVAVDDLAYTDGTGYLRVDPGMRNIKVNAAGTDVTAIEVDQELAESTAYTAIATGTSGDEAFPLELLLLQDDLTAPAEGNIRVRAVHAAPGVDLEPVDIYVTAVNGATQEADTLVGVSPAVSAASFGAVADPIEVPAGTYRIRIARADPAADPQMEPDVVYDSGAQEIAAGSVWTVAALQAPKQFTNGATTAEGDSPVTLAILTNEADRPAFLVADVHTGLRAVHAVPGANPVNLFADDTALATGLAFGAVTPMEGYHRISSDATIALVTEADVRVELPQEQTLERGQRHTLIAIPAEAGGLETLLLMDGDAAPTAERAKVRIAHLSADVDVGNVDVWVDGVPVAGASDVPFRTVSEYLELAGGDRMIRIFRAGTTDTPLFSTTETFVAGHVYTLLIIGDRATLDALVLQDPVRSAPADTGTDTTNGGVPADETTDPVDGDPVDQAA